MISAHNFSVYNLIERNALLFPDKTAVVGGDNSLTFKELFMQVNALASSLYKIGIKSGRSAAVLSMNRSEYLVLYGAAAAVGAVLVPLNWRLSLNELKYILHDSGAEILFFGDSQKEQAEALAAENSDNMDMTFKFKGMLVNFDEKGIFDDEHRISDDNQKISYEKKKIFDKKRITASFNAEKSSEDSIKNFAPVLSNPDDIFTLIYTAAVAGKPRGAALSHSNIISSNLQTALTMNLTHNDSYLNMLPLFHITGMNLSLAVMHAGGKNVIIPKFDAKEALSAVEREKITLMASFPPILSTLMEEIDKSDKLDGTNEIDKKYIDAESAVKDYDKKTKYDISSLKYTVGIDSPQNIAEFCGKTSSIFWILYGQSETSGFVTLSDSSECSGSAGRQCSISDIAVVDDNDLILPSGQSGEIVVRGPIVFQGFWKGEKVNNLPKGLSNDEKTESEANCLYDTSTIRNGWHHTGDVGHIDSNGYLWFEGRKPEKELIKPGGENVYPAEVEAVILGNPDIEQTCVIGVPHPKFGEGVKAVCVKKQGSQLTEKELIDFAVSRIARYKKPSYVEFAENLPKNSNGTIDRKKVKELYGK